MMSDKDVGSRYKRVGGGDTGLYVCQTFDFISFF